MIDTVLRSPDPVNRPNSLVDTTGNLKWIADWEVEKQLGIGWRRITNPRKNYFPQYDQRFSSVQVGGELVENVEVTDVLSGEWV